MDVSVMLALRPPVAPNPVLAETFRILRRRGCNIDLGTGDELLLQLDHLAVTYDLYILKSHAALWLSLAEIVHAHGGLLLNPLGGCVAVQNKIVAVQRMRDAGIPTPRSWVTGDPRLLRAMVEPLVIDLNYFPSYQGVPHAAGLIADYIEDYALGRGSTRVRDVMGAIDGAVA